MILVPVGGEKNKWIFSRGIDTNRSHPYYFYRCCRKRIPQGKTSDLKEGAVKITKGGMIGWVCLCRVSRGPGIRWVLECPVGDVNVVVITLHSAGEPCCI